MKESKRLAACSLMVSLTVVLMVLGAVLELGTYAAPMLASLCLIPVGQRYGKKYQTLLWLAASGLSFLLVPNPEQNLMFFGVFGWYPIVRSRIQKLPLLGRVTVKFLAFNMVMLAIEALVMLVLIPETMSTGMLAAFLILMNVLFFCYDYLLPLMERLVHRFERYL